MQKTANDPQNSKNRIEESSQKCSSSENGKRVGDKETKFINFMFDSFYDWWALNWQLCFC